MTKGVESLMGRVEAGGDKMILKEWKRMIWGCKLV